MSDLLNALRRLKVETGSLVCMGCGHEHSCGVHGCAIIRAAIEELEIPADENAKVKRIKNQRYEINCLKNKIKKLMRRIESLERRKFPERPAWVSVEDRLPEIKEHHVSDDVLVLFDDGGMGFSALEESIFGQTWFECERIYPDGERHFTVTHWLPLPEPPKEVSDGH